MTILPFIKNIPVFLPFLWISVCLKKHNDSLSPADNHVCSRKVILFDFSPFSDSVNITFTPKKIENHIKSIDKSTQTCGPLSYGDFRIHTSHDKGGTFYVQPRYHMAKWYGVSHIFFEPKSIIFFWAAVKLAVAPFYCGQNACLKSSFFSNRIVKSFVFISFLHKLCIWGLPHQFFHLAGTRIS